MKLELEELLPYLPFGLKLNCSDGRTEELSALSQYSLNIKNRGTIYGMFSDIDEIKPILRPMLDLKKSNELISLLGLYTEADLNYTIQSPLELSYSDIQKLFRDHYDVFGLIDQGLAVDINTVESL